MVIIINITVVPVYSSGHIHTRQAVSLQVSFSREAPFPIQHIADFLAQFKHISSVLSAV